MRVDYRVNENCSLSVEVKNSKEAFQFMAMCDTVYGIKTCGNCGKHDLARKYKKTPEGYEYYSIECRDCGYEHKFGQPKDGGPLFPKGWVPPYVKGESNNGGYEQNDTYHDAYSERSQRHEPAPARREMASDGVPF